MIFDLQTPIAVSTEFHRSVDVNRKKKHVSSLPPVRYYRRLKPSSKHPKVHATKPFAFLITGESFIGGSSLVTFFLKKDAQNHPTIVTRLNKNKFNICVGGWFSYRAVYRRNQIIAILVSGGIYIYINIYYNALMKIHYLRAR